MWLCITQEVKAAAIFVVTLSVCDVILFSFLYILARKGQPMDSQCFRAQRCVFLTIERLNELTKTDVIGIYLRLSQRRVSWMLVVTDVLPAAV